MTPAGTTSDYNDFAIATGIVPVINNGVPHIICLLGIITVVLDVVLSWKRMDRTIHFKMRRCQAIFNRYTHEPKQRNVLGNLGFHFAGVVAASVNHDHYAMSSAVVDVVHGRSNVHAINDFVGLNYAGRRRWGLGFGEISSAYQGCKENGFLHFNEMDAAIILAWSRLLPQWELRFATQRNTFALGE